MPRILRLLLIALLIAPVWRAGERPAVAQSVLAAPPYVVLGPDGTPIARAITTADTCPTVSFAGLSVPMQPRAVPSPAFPVLSCELPIPPSVFSASIEGHHLPLVPVTPRRIAVLGDTGCRIAGSRAQGCNDPDQWPLATIAQSIAAYRPDLIIHVGDFLYREDPCPAAASSCAGSPYGDTWAAWRADWFAPAAPAFLAAPWVMVRGNHEVCQRGAEGWFRFLDPWPYQERCQSVTEPYRIAFDELNLVVVDSGVASDVSAPEDQVEIYRAQLERALTIARDQTWLVTHRPPYAVSGFSTPPDTAASNLTLAAAAPAVWPEGVQLILSGHVHLWEAVGFALSATGRPSQIVVGNSGTMLESSFTLSFEGLRIAGELASPESRYVTDQFGFMTFEPVASGGWVALARDRNGYPMVTCTVRGKQVACR
ncbi:MAG: ser/threonine protein phosphatase [Dehalococcoidia bacterium]|nr:MAG: ser/threonine protein phosphatase [Dehalococcoidia bacterium]